jgi:hypothetical protein
MIREKTEIEMLNGNLVLADQGDNISGATGAFMHGVNEGLMQFGQYAGWVGGFVMGITILVILLRRQPTIN